MKTKMDYSESIKVRKARKKVEILMDFYKHLVVYIFVNIALLLVRSQILGLFQNGVENKNFYDWIDWNIVIVPFFWGIGLLFHAAKAFQYKFRFIQNWEDKQLENILKNNKD